MRPANDLLQVMYCASSSLRACTLKLPSVVLRSAFSSLKVNASFTASALTMPSRTRSWIRRSSSAARKARSPRGGAATASGFRTAPDLATVPPCDNPAEHDVQAAESARQAPGSPRREPQLGAALAGRYERGGERGGPDRDLAPPRHRRERPRALHGLTDVAQIVEGAVVQGTRRRHGPQYSGTIDCCQVLCNTK